MLVCLKFIQLVSCCLQRFRVKCNIAVLMCLLSGLILNTAFGNTNHFQAVGDKKTKHHIMQCPDISALKKIKEGKRENTWFANGGWQSNDISFADQVKQFVGAQWKGSNLGNLVCVYETLQLGVQRSITFPILLRYHVLVFLPTKNEGQWERSSDASNMDSVMNCHSKNPEDCQFLSSAEEKEEKDVFQALLDVKKNNAF